MFRFPLDVAIAPDGTCYVAGSIHDYGDGCGPHARFRRPGVVQGRRGSE